jgi:adenylosuccinate synthase
VRVNGMTSLALTKLDVLSAFDELPVCVRYRLRDGSETEHFPAHQSDFHHAEPVWEVLPGWRQPLDGATSLADLPGPARAYVEFVAAALQLPIELVGVGASREHVLA